MSSTVDRLDCEIVGRLSLNARVGIAELAAGLGVSRNTITLRMQRLEGSGVLRGFRPVLELAAIGLPIQGHVSVEIEQHQLGAIVTALAKIPKVLEVRTQAGREDLDVHVAAADLEDLQSVAMSIVGVDGVRHTTTTLSVSTPVPYRVQPLLEHLSHDRGWGRSTPLPR